MKKIFILLLLLSLAFCNQKVIPPYNPAYWDDLRFPATATKLGATSKPDFDFTNVGLLFPQNDESEIVYINAQMPHKWAETTVNLHVHFVQASAVTPTFLIAYRWFPLGTTAIGAFTIITSNMVAMPYTSGSIHQLADFPDVTPPTSTGVSSMLDIKLYRKTGDGLTGDVLVKEMDMHYQIDAPGSRQEYIK
jgi:hypothetical protein